MPCHAPEKIHTPLHSTAVFRMNKLTLFIPGILGPLPELLDANCELPKCQILEHWFSRAKSSRTKSHSYFAQLAELFDITHDFSVAQMSAYMDGCIDHQSCRFRIDPVHFKPDMDHAILLDNQQLNIQPSEAEALIESFNQHFLEDGLKLVSTHQSRWYLTSDEPLSLKTIDIHDAVGRSVSHFLPKGEDELIWRRFLNEAQMLFHNHPVNQAREQSGQLTINSLWVWGEGETVELTKCEFNWIYSREIISSGLAKLASCKQLPMDTSVDDVLKQEGNGLLVLDEIMGPVSYGDVAAWAESVMSICQTWLAAIDIGLKQKQYQQIDIYTGEGRLFSVNRKTFFDFLRSNKSLKDYVNTCA